MSTPTRAQQLRNLIGGAVRRKAPQHEIDEMRRRMSAAKVLDEIEKSGSFYPDDADLIFRSVREKTIP